MLSRIWQRIKAEKQGSKVVIQMAQFWAGYVESEESIKSSAVLQAYANFPEKLRDGFRKRAIEGVVESLKEPDIGYQLRTRLLIAAEATLMARLLKLPSILSRDLIYKYLNQSWAGKVLYSDQDWSDGSIDVYWIIGQIDSIYSIELLSRLRKTIFLSHETIPLPDITLTLETAQSIIEEMFKSIAEGDRSPMSHLKLMGLEETFARSGKLEMA